MLPVTAELSSAPENLNVTLTSSLYNGTTTSQNSTTLAPNSKTKVADVPYAGKTSFDDLFDEVYGMTLDRDNAEDMDTLLFYSSLFFGSSAFVETSSNEITSYGPYYVLSDFFSNDPIELFPLYTDTLEEDLYYCIENGYYYSAFFLIECLYMSFYDMLFHLDEIATQVQDGIYQIKNDTNFEFHISQGDYYIYINGEPITFFQMSTNCFLVSQIDPSSVFQDELTNEYFGTEDLLLEGYEYSPFMRFWIKMRRGEFDPSDENSICDYVNYFVNETLANKVAALNEFAGLNVGWKMIQLGLTPFFDSNDGGSKQTLYNPQKLFDFCKSNNHTCLLITIRFQIADVSSPASFDGKLRIILGAA